jgi:polyisoprenoid-binding protein YceI
MMMKKSVINAGPVLLALYAALPATQAAGSGLGSAKAGSYKVDSYHTQVGFSISHFGFTNYYGLFSVAKGALQLDPAKLSAAKLDISLQVDSITTTVAQLTDELKGDKWFDTAKYPTASFSSTKVVPTIKGATVTGNLTLHGLTKPVVLEVRFIGAGVNPIDKAYTVGFEATATIKRSDFGVTTYVPAIGDEVQLNIAGAFEQQQG